MRDQCYVNVIKSQITRGVTITWEKDYNLKHRSKDDWISPPIYMEEIPG
jgi:hypothetical protein